MPGQRSSLVCCWGPAAFHLPGWICYESFGGGKVCTFFKFCLCGKTGWIFKPDTIIINHQLEFSGTRVEYLDHEKRAYKHEIISHIRKKPQITPHYGASRETRCLKVVWGLLQLAYFVYAKSKSPGEAMRTCRLVGAFATCRCNKNHDQIVCWPIYSNNFSLQTVYFIFLFSIIIWIVKISKHCQSAYI